MSYIPPRWAQMPNDPTQEWSLVEIKGGVEVGQHPLHTRACTVLGRAADQVDIVLQHESTSRQHARIAFDSGGYPWLRDLASTHGTMCNKQPLPPPAVGKLERDDHSHSKGSRGVMIFPGDVLRFGASTRLFCVEGPSEFERGAFQARQQQLLLEQQKRLEDRQTEALHREEDGEADALEEPVRKMVPMDAEVPLKHQKTLERLNAAKYKLQNLQTEDERIRRKGELSEGQEKQLQRNAEREKALMESIESMETELYDKLYPEQTGKESFAQRRQQTQAVEPDEDEFFDRTKRVDKSVVEDGESETTLTEKWNRLQSHLCERWLPSLESAKIKVDRLSSQHSDLETRGDTEEAFFLQNDLQLAKEDLQKISKAISETESNLAELEKFLRVVNPKLRFDRISGYIGTGGPKQFNEETTSEQSMAPPSPEKHSFAMLPPPSQSLVVQPDTFAMLPPPPKRGAPTATTMDESSLEQVLPEAMMSPPKRIRVVGPAMPPPQNADSESDRNRLSRPAKDHQRVKVQSTLSFLSSMNPTKKIVNSTSSLPKEAASDAGTVVTLDPKADIWRAPSGQDGSGKTKLNAKFAGRY